MRRPRAAAIAIIVFGHPLFRFPLHALVAPASKHVVHPVETFVAEIEPEAVPPLGTQSLGCFVAAEITATGVACQTV